MSKEIEALRVIASMSLDKMSRDIAAKALEQSEPQEVDFEYERIKLKVGVVISATNMSGNEKVDAIMNLLQPKSEPRMFSEEEMKKSFIAGRSYQQAEVDEYYGGGTHSFPDFKQFIQSLSPQPTEPVKQINNCDGCQSNAPLDGIYHLDKDGKAYMICQKGRYQPTEPIDEGKEESTPMSRRLTKCIYNDERYDVPYSEMGRWYAFMKDLSIFTLDAGNCQIEFSDAFSKYKVALEPNQTEAPKEQPTVEAEKEAIAKAWAYISKCVRVNDKKYGGLLPC